MKTILKQFEFPLQKPSLFESWRFERGAKEVQECYKRPQVEVKNEVNVEVKVMVQVVMPTKQQSINVKHGKRKKVKLVNSRTKK